MKKNFVFILLLIALILFSLYKYIFTIKEGKKGYWPPPPPLTLSDEDEKSVNRLFCNFKRNNYTKDNIVVNATNLLSLVHSEDKIQKYNNSYTWYNLSTSPCLF